MDIQLSESLISMVIGIRFRANFSIEDQLGQIVDQILYSKDSYFNPKKFPLVQSGVGRKILANQSTGDQLTIDNSNIILEIVFGDSFAISDLNRILECYESEIIKGIMKKFAIKEIVRVGYIKRYIFKIEKLAKKFVDKTIGSTLEGINDIHLSFSKKLPVDEALVKDAVNDYDNAIFTVIKKADLDEIFMSVDYQRYYDPFLPLSTEVKFIPFIDRAEKFNVNRYLPWLKSNYLED